ncbi:MAG: hypothetical protein LBI48_05950 [Burkholderiaceae bacterium]|nr:hypothetical protein [Burkholderiaceae bacterium]
MSQFIKYTKIFCGSMFFYILLGVNMGIAIIYAMWSHILISDKLKLENNSNRWELESLVITLFSYGVIIYALWRLHPRS